MFYEAWIERPIDNLSYNGFLEVCRLGKLFVFIRNVFLSSSVLQLMWNLIKFEINVLHEILLFDLPNAITTGSIVFIHCQLRLPLVGDYKTFLFWTKNIAMRILVKPSCVLFPYPSILWRSFTQVPQVFSFLFPQTRLSREAALNMYSSRQISQTSETLTVY